MKKSRLILPQEALEGADVVSNGRYACEAAAVNDTSREQILLRIGGLVRSLLTDIGSRQIPSLSLNIFQICCSNMPSPVVSSDPSPVCCNCSYEYPNGKEIISFCKQTHASRLNLLLRVLAVVQKLLLQNRHCSKRDIYYMYPSIFIDQTAVDRAINDICRLLRCSHHHLNVVPAGKGLFMGWLSIVEKGRKIQCSANPNTAYPIPIWTEYVQVLTSCAHYILVVEKEAVFQRLADDGFCEKNRCIVVTGKGYPDVPTRRFVRHLVENLHLPIYCLVDFDPYGVDILATYRFGSMRMAYDAKFLCLPKMRWLGVFPSDLDKLCLPDCCLLQLTLEDRRRVEALLSRCYLRKEAPQWRLELNIMLQKGVKFEIEALSAHSMAFLSEAYIPQKIELAEYI